jgi:hypothetical protein
MALPVATLGCFLWAVRFLVPKALKEHDVLAIAAAVMTAALALLAWLLIGVRVVAVNRVLSQKAPISLSAASTANASSICSKIRCGIRSSSQRPARTPINTAGVRIRFTISV